MPAPELIRTVIADSTRRVARDAPARRVLVLTTFDLDEYVYEALKAGAGGFLLNDSPRAELLHALRTVARGSELLEPAITRRLIEDVLQTGPLRAGLCRIEPNSSGAPISIIVRSQT